MNNKEHFNDKPLKDALAKYEADLKAGSHCGFADWLNTAFVDLAKGAFVRGRFYPYDETAAKIAKMESRKVTGYLLEWQNEKGEWYGSEFQPEKGTDSNLWCNDFMKDATDDWYENEVGIGFFKELPTAWFNDSCDWDYRLGVDFDSRTTPEKNPKEDGVWEGLTKGGCAEEGDPWRVRKITINGTLSDKVRAFLRRNPDVRFDYADAE